MAVVQWIGLSLLMFFQPQLGSLVLDSEPMAEVSWEGVRLGLTDARGRLRIAQIPAGSYRISIRKEGYRNLNHRIAIVPGLQTVELPLVRLAGDSPAPPERLPTPASVAPRREAPPSTDRRPAPKASELPRLSLVMPSEEGLPPGEANSPGATHIIWFLLFGGLLAVVLAALSRWPLAPSAPAPDRFRVNLPDLSEPGVGATGNITFLRDLRRREEFAKDGIEIIQPDANPQRIDLDPDSVRIVED